ncbi:MAG TPA: sugar ABC transporter ATP-binding protein [Acidimicrobiales bacterium]|nr:sugar ABC transporter ATP-binding protein [Acidimicrobiales bacterium]
MTGDLPGGRSSASPIPAGAGATPAGAPVPDQAAGVLSAVQAAGVLPAVQAAGVLPLAGAAGVTPVVEALQISKRFGSTQALSNVDLTLAPGRCLGLVGRNGAGKSTMVSILSGIVAPDTGSVSFGGEPAPSLADPAAWHRRIATVYQHSMVVPWLTVAENVFLGRYPTHWHGAVDWAAMRSETARIMQEWGVEVDVRQQSAGISVEQRQVVEIARALAGGTRCLLLDEPTAALERSAISRLFERVRALVASGVAVLYISHHLEEVFEICDSVAVLRDGQLVLTSPAAGLDEARLVSAMVGERGRLEGEAVATRSSSGRAAQGTARLVVRDVRAEDVLGGKLDGVSLEVAPGERLGVTGLRGSGATTLGRVVAGATPFSAGEVVADGRPLRSGRPDLALGLGIGYVPEDRRGFGFVPQLGVAENTTMTVAKRLGGRFGITTRARRAMAAKPVLDSLEVVASGSDQPVAELSGGNQQKVTVARALIISPGVLVAICPTRGVDVASKALLLESLASFSETSHASLLLATEELDDLAICDRVLVMLHGKVFCELADPPFDHAELIAASEGLLAGSATPR